MKPGAALLAIGLLAGCAVRRPTPNTVTAEGILARTGHPVATSPDSLPPGVNLERPLTAGDAAQIAIWKNPQLRADLATIGLAEADLIDANLMRNPRLDTLAPIGAKPFELLLNFPIEVFWQRPKRVAAAQAALDQIAQSLVVNGLNTARDAHLAHADLALAVARVEVAKQSVDLRGRVATITEARLRAGDISELETIASRTELGTAREQLARFEADVPVATERLRAVLGLAVERTPLSVVVTPASMDSPPAIDTLLEKAMATRPDLRAAELAVAAAMKRVKWERSRILVLSAQLSSKEVGTNGVLTGPGASLELPVFHRNQGLIARAEAEIEIASRQYLVLKQRVALEVAEARGLMVQAQTTLQKIREEVLPPLQRANELSSEQYRRGDVAFLFVLEQNRGLIDAQLRIVDAEAAIRRAQAQLERSVGGR